LQVEAGWGTGNNHNHLQGQKMTQDTTEKPADSFQGFDLSTVEDVGTAEYELKHPITGEGIGAFILLAGPEHPDRRRITMALVRKMRADALRKSQKPQDPEEDLEESREMLVKITLGWRGIAKAGAPLVFSAAAARELYADPKSQWLVKQLLSAMNDQELFIRA
jgi:hypothetical protein